MFHLCYFPQIKKKKEKIKTHAEVETADLLEVEEREVLKRLMARREQLSKEEREVFTCVVVSVWPF